MVNATTPWLRPFRRLLPALSFATAMLAGVAGASAQTTIRRPGDRASYHVELEPHLAVAPIEPPDLGAGAGVGAGARFTFEVAKDGFIPQLNDSIAVGFGIDALHYVGSGEYRGRCTRFEPAPGNTRVCVELDPDGDAADYVFSEAVMQWNFWLHRRWSAFGEPGVALYLRNGREFGVAPAFFVGGRFHATDRVALTLRLGYPAFSFGVSFLL